MNFSCPAPIIQTCPALREVSVSLQISGGAVQLKDLEFPNTTPGFRRYHVEQVAADVKETIGRVSDGPFDAEQNASIPTVNYEVTCMCTVPSWGID